MMETILLTGFGPFASHTQNVTQDAVQRLDGLELHGFRVRALALPVQFERAVALLEEALAEQPAAVICSGIHSGEEPVFRVELAARNERNYEHPDADGDLVKDACVEQDAPPMVISTLPVAAIKQAWERLGIPAELSDDAGVYLCNAIFYWTARRITPAGFLHVPPDPAGIDDVVRAIEAALDATASRLAAQQAPATA